MEEAKETIENALYSCGAGKTFTTDQCSQITEGIIGSLKDTKITFCSSTERAFLDEIREKGEMEGFSFSNKRWIKIKGSQETVIYPDDFNTPLEELVNDTKPIQNPTSI